MYTPPFKITKSTDKLIDQIDNLIKTYEFSTFGDKKVLLRINNRIKSINSTCAIEANSLSLAETRDIINGIPVIGNKREILEIKNANKAYQMAEKLDPFLENNLLKIHKVLMDNLTDRNGKYRLSFEGVFAGEKCIFMAPPADQVPKLMKDLFSWLNSVKNRLSPLIYACVFHYEFVFIHPFTDGNGRIARLRNTLLLANYSPIFLYLPIENQIKLHQVEYYKAINSTNIKGESTVFLNFMLKMILNTLETTLNEKSKDFNKKSLLRLMKVMPYNKEMSAKEIKQALGITSLYGLKNGYLDQAIELGYVKPVYPDKITSPNQKYKRVVTLENIKI